jgi:hypothetical protein
MVARLWPIIHFTKGSHRYEVFKGGSSDQPAYSGYIDGAFLVSGAEAHVVTRALLDAAPSNQPYSAQLAYRSGSRTERRKSQCRTQDDARSRFPNPLMAGILFADSGWANWSNVVRGLFRGGVK